MNAPNSVNISAKNGIYSLLRLWFPLACTWWMMALEGPVITAYIARMPLEAYNLAAYGVTFSIALILEAPVIMLLSASNALVKGPNSYRSLLKYSLYLSALTVVVGLIGILIFPYWVNLFPFPQPIKDRIYYSLWIMLPWAPFIGMRRFYQGILIGAGKSIYVALGSVIRVFGVCFVIVLGFIFSPNANFAALIGALALIAGVGSESITIYFLTKKTIKELKASSLDHLSSKEILSFSLPLIFTSLLALGTQPIITFFVGFCARPIESLAVIPVVSSLVFFFRCVAFSFQDAAISFVVKGKGSMVTLRHTSLILGIGFSLLMVLMRTTPLGHFWFLSIASLPVEFIDLAQKSMTIMIFIPLFSVALGLYRAQAVKYQKTTWVSHAMIVEVAVIVLVMTLAQKTNLDGASASALAIVLGRFFGFGSMFLEKRLYLKKHPEALLES